MSDKPNEVAVFDAELKAAGLNAKQRRRVLSDFEENLVVRSKTFYLECDASVTRQFGAEVSACALLEAAIERFEKAFGRPALVARITGD